MVNKCKITLEFTHGMKVIMDLDTMVLTTVDDVGLINQESMQLNQVIPSVRAVVQRLVDSGQLQGKL